MDRLSAKPRGRCVIVHTNRLVAEDLRQLLLALGADTVDIATALEEVRPGLDAVVFVEGAATALHDTPKIAEWHAAGTPVVAMNGRRGTDGPVRGIHLLEQPFRSDDVVALLRDLKVF